MRHFKAIAFFLLVILVTANAQIYQITTKSVHAKIGETGDAIITEKFFLTFPNDLHLRQFREESEKMGVDLQAWQEFNPEFKPSMGGLNDTTVSDIGFVENEARYLELKYELSEPLMLAETETSRMMEYSLNKKLFNNYIEGSLWVIPSNTTIILDLPTQADILDPIRPEASVSGNRVQWTGYKSTNQLSVNYIIWKQISSITLNEFVTGIVSHEFFPILLAVLIVFAFLIFWKRKELAGRIEKYIVEHSDFSNMEESDN